MGRPGAPRAGGDDAVTLPEPRIQLEIDQRVFDLYDEYCHGGIDRREFLTRAARVGGALAMAQALLPRYAEAQTVSFTDTRIKAQYATYPSRAATRGRYAAIWCSRRGRARFRPCS
jgi:carboxymethylenebutenolidase